MRTKTSFSFVIIFIMAVIACLVTLPARAETWVQAIDSPIAGLESCIDTDSIRVGSDGKIEFRFRFCGLDKVIIYRVDCRQDLSEEVAIEDMRDGVFRQSKAPAASPLADSAKWVCSRR